MCLTVTYFDTEAYLDNNCDKSFGILFSSGSEYNTKNEKHKHSKTKIYEVNVTYRYVCVATIMNKICSLMYVEAKTLFTICFKKVLEYDNYCKEIR